MESEILRVLGFTEGDMKVYFAILKSGKCGVNKIHEESNLGRRHIYDILNKLIKKGLISYTIEKGKKNYQCSDPNKIKEDLTQKQRELQKAKESFPEILNLYNSSKSEINAEVYRGKEGIKAIFDDMLNYKEAFFIGGGWYVVRELPYFWPHYNKKRLQKKIKWFNLLRNEFKNKKVSKSKLISVRVLPKEFSGVPSVIFIYGNKIVNVSWNENFAFMIENKGIAENHKKYFDYLWKQVKS